MFKLNVVTPSKRLVVGQEVEEVVVPAHRGELNLLPGHAPLVTTLEPGILRWRLKGQTEMNEAAVGWGYCQVHPQGIDILAEVADLPADANVAQAEKDLTDFEKRLMNETLDEQDFEMVRRQIALAKAEIEVAKHQTH